MAGTMCQYNVDLHWPHLLGKAAIGDVCTLCTAERLDPCTAAADKPRQGGCATCGAPVPDCLPLRRCAPARRPLDPAQPHIEIGAVACIRWSISSRSGGAGLVKPL